MLENVKPGTLQSNRVVLHGRTFEFRFWDDLYLHVPYAGIYEIITEQKKRLFTRRPYTVEKEICIDCRWGAADRVKWCYKTVAKHIVEEKQAIADLKKIQEFCEKTLDI